MKKIIQLLFVMVFIFSESEISDARSKRVSQIPNGSKFSCANCHINPNSGGARNQFGLAVQNGFLDSNGDVLWNNSLAGLDSDSDGATNGAELQDANGFWSVSQAQPGDVNLVSNPGDAGSTTEVLELDFVSAPSDFDLAQNYPNPFNPITQIRFTLSKSGFVSLEVFNVKGQKVKTLVSSPFSAGAFSVDWNGTNDFGESVRSGVYLYRIQTEQFQASKRMIFMK